MNDLSRFAITATDDLTDEPTLRLIVEKFIEAAGSPVSGIHIKKRSDLLSEAGKPETIHVNFKLEVDRSFPWEEIYSHVAEGRFCTKKAYLEWMGRDPINATQRRLHVDMTLREQVKLDIGHPYVSMDYMDLGSDRYESPRFEDRFNSFCDAAPKDFTVVPVRHSESLPGRFVEAWPVAVTGYTPKVCYYTVPGNVSISEAAEVLSRNLTRQSDDGICYVVPKFSVIDGAFPTLQLQQLVSTSYRKPNNGTHVRLGLEQIRSIFGLTRISDEDVVPLKIIDALIGISQRFGFLYADEKEGFHELIGKLSEYSLEDPDRDKVELSAIREGMNILSRLFEHIGSESASGSTKTLDIVRAYYLTEFVEINCAAKKRDGTYQLTIKVDEGRSPGVLLNITEILDEQLGMNIERLKVENQPSTGDVDIKIRVRPTIDEDGFDSSETIAMAMRGICIRKREEDASDDQGELVHINLDLPNQRGSQKQLYRMLLRKMNASVVTVDSYPGRVYTAVVRLRPTDNLERLRENLNGMVIQLPDDRTEAITLISIVNVSNDQVEIDW